MPPKPKITREMILRTVLEITQETGFEAVNARSIAGRLRCSTRPIFTCYENMDELKKKFLDFAFEYYTRYTAVYSSSAPVPPYLIHPLSYIEFAKKETHLFKLIFITDMDLDMKKGNDFYKETGNRKKARAFSDMLGVELEQGERIFLDLFLYAHGIAVLTATKKLSLSSEETEKMLLNFLSAFVPGVAALRKAGTPQTPGCSHRSPCR